MANGFRGSLADPGFVLMPGVDTCIKIGGYVSVDVAH